MHWRILLAIVMSALFIVRFILLKSNRPAEGTAEAGAPGRAVSYPADWPVEGLSVPAGASPAATSTIQALSGRLSGALSVDLGGVAFRAVGFNHPEGWNHVANHFAGQAEAAGFHRCRASDEMTVAFESGDNRVEACLIADTADGPFTLMTATQLQ